MTFNNLLTWLRENYEPWVAESAEENIRKYWTELLFDNYKKDTLDELLLHGFIWIASEEGHDFWEKIHKELLDLEKRS